MTSKPDDPGTLLGLQEFNIDSEEAHETLRAIHHGEIDALVIRSAERQQIYTLKGADRIYRTIIEAMSEAALILGADGTLLYCNGRFAELVGQPLETVMGTCVQRYVEAQDLPAFERILEQGLGGHGKGEVGLVAQDGQRVHVLVSIDSIAAEGLQGCGAAILTDVSDLRDAQHALQRAHDQLERRVEERTADLTRTNAALQQEIAERTRLEQELRRTAEELAEADRRKDRFIATLAHELRNPLAPIMNAAQLLERTGMDKPEQLEWARDIIERQVRQLTRLVNDLLDVSRITRDKITLQKQRVALAQVIDNAVETTQPLIEERGHTLQIGPSPPLVVEADPMRLAQVLSNLLNNAAKYTAPGGHVWLSVEQQGTEAVIRVRDDGQGIPQEVLPRVFDLFTQADHSLEQAQGGLGIGLSLVRNLVALHNGSVEAISAGSGQGSEFIVRLPLPEAAGMSAEALG
jgi:PAS domain S-box-containing protein